MRSWKLCAPALEDRPRVDVLACQGRGEAPAGARDLRLRQLRGLGKSRLVEVRRQTQGPAVTPQTVTGTAAALQ